MAAEPMVKLIVAVAAALLIQQAGISAPAAIDDSNTPALKPPSRIDYLSFALHREGDSANGNALFHDQQRLACAKCHTTDGQAGKAGPDLFAVGDKFGRRELIESVLWPSASIAVGYSTTSIETRSGEEFTGIIKQVTDDWVELVGADSSPVRISSKDILERRTSEISFMPEGLEASLTLAEFADLIEYLVSLKQPENTAIVEHGMPSVIPLLPKPVELEPFLAASLRFEHPVWFGPVPGETNVFLVAEHETGRVWRLEKESGGDRKTPFADLGQYQKGTRGLLGLVLHPHFDRNGRYFFARHLVENGKFSTWICERQAGPEKREDSGQATRVLLRLDEATNVHYGGGLQFGPDGFLYIGMGDSGPQEDPQGHSQNTLLWLGKMLRIDVDHRNAEQSYSVPSSNPFVSRNDIRPEIWAYGLREPWRFSFDALTGELWVGDVGQDRYEEIDLVRAGQNYGWNVYEGFEPFSNRYRREQQKYAPPVFAYARKFGVSVTGGYVYRGDPGCAFYGVYIFGDYQSRRLFGLTQQQGRLETVRQIGTAPERIVSFGCDWAGALYLVGYEGMIFKLNFAGAAFP